MKDSEFLAAFHDGSLTSSEFTHRGHLRLAFLVLKDHPPNEAAIIISREIKRFATSQGAPGRYHETLTRFWVQMVGHAMEEAPDVKNISELLERFPLLLEKALPYRHWSQPIFDSSDARNGWISPDLFPLPQTETFPHSP